MFTFPPNGVERYGLGRENLRTENEFAVKDLHAAHRWGSFPTFN